MKYEPLTCIRYKDGFTSSTYFTDYLLTSSITGKICQWDLITGNQISEFQTNLKTKFCIPYSQGICDRFDKLVLQTNDHISLFDVNNKTVETIAHINTKCFARLSLLSSSSHPLIISPSGLNLIKMFDLRVNSGNSKFIEVLEIGPIKINHPKKSELGMIHNCLPFYSVGDSCIISTYESGSIVIYDIRKPNEPLVPIYITDSLEPIPSLSVWNNVFLVGDTVGNISMFYASKDKGIVLMKTKNISPESLKPPGINNLSIRSDGAVLVAGCWDRCVRVFETKTLDLKCILDPHYSSIVDVSYSKTSNQFSTASSDGNANIWNLF
uniref:WD domain, G-beta repeat, putative n=1 Tax=Theileria annulata TaxID=5874 RepID=A0A3B0NCQ3_THEAN